MKPFNLEEAKAGKPVVTRDGKVLRILATDIVNDTGYCIVGALTEEDGRETIQQFTAMGNYLSSCKDNRRDLFMKSEKVSQWTNVYRDNQKGFYFNAGFYDSERDALTIVNKTLSLSTYIDTVEVTFEI